MPSYLKIGLFISGCLAFLILVVYVITKVIFLGSFIELEEQNTRQNVQRTEDALAGEMATLSSKAGDWANFDDTYAFIEDGNPEYVKANPTDTSFMTLRVDLMLFLHSSGRIVYSKAFDLESGHEVPVPEPVLQDPRVTGLFLQYLDSKEGLTGILQLPKGPMLIAARPILTSDGGGPAHGILVFGRYLDDEEIQALAETTHISLAIEPFQGINLPSDFQSARLRLAGNTDSLFVQPLTEQSIAGYALLGDVFGQPALLLRVDQPRDIYAQGQASVRYFLLAVSALALLFGIVAQVLTGISLLSRKAQRASERRYRTLAEAAPDSIFIVDRMRRLQYVNTTAARQFGLAQDQAMGRSFDALLPRASSDRLNAQIVQTAVSNIPAHFEEKILFHDQARWLDTKLVPLGRKSGEAGSVLGVARDVTDRKRGEEKIQRQLELLASLREIYQAINASENPDHALEILLTQFTRQLGVDAADILLLNEEAKTLDYAAGRGFRSQPVPSLCFGLGEGYAGQAALERRVVQVHDAPESTSTFFNSERLAGEGFVTYYALPLIVSGRVNGVMEIFHRAPLDPDEDWLDLLHALMAQAGIALENAHLLSEVQRELTVRVRTEQALKESEERYALAAQGANDGLWDWNLQTQVIYYSSRWKMMFGYREEEIGDSPEEWFSRVHPEDLQRVKTELSAHWEGQSSHFESEHRMQHKNGMWRWVLSRGLAVRGADGTPLRTAGSLSDITARKRAESQLLHDAFHDGLTGLPNRSLFMDRLGRSIERAKRNDRYLYAVLYLDFDGFKLVNDSLGHSIGDQLLVSGARRLEVCLRSEDTVARLGGDEFAILLEDVRDVQDVRVIAERIQKELARPFDLEGHQVFVSASIGIVLHGRHVEDPGQVLRNADIALYSAKAQGRARYELFDTAMLDGAIARLQLESDLRSALEHQEFLIHYQPIVWLESGRIAGFEALLRWPHPTRGFVPPSEFIPVAEETGLILPLGNWVLREACRQMAEWQAQHPTSPSLTLNVNLSSRQFTQPDLGKQIEEILRETGLPASSLRLEITESVVMVNGERTIEILQQLRRIGVQVEIDDFGTGYSSLSYLHRFPIDTLKIDRSFIGQMNAETGKISQRNGFEILHTITSLAQGLGMKVVAEGIETEEQVTKLKEIGCELGQGYYFSEPSEPEAIFASFTASRVGTVRPGKAASSG